MQKLTPARAPTLIERLRQLVESPRFTWFIVTSFAVLNLVVAVIVNSMQIVHEAGQKEEREAERQIVHEETAALASEIRALRRELGEVKSLLEERGEKATG
jgi:voltage-gated sodium channel